MPRQVSDFEQQLISLIKPLNTAKYTADCRWDRLEESFANLGADYGGLEMNPDYQRGHDWSRDQQQYFIENCLRGVVPSSGFLLQFNCPHWNDDPSETDLPPGLQCVDGLQRYTAIAEYLKGNVKPFGRTAQELARTNFGPSRFYMKIAIHGFTRRVDLLEHYLAFNAGGTPHSPEEIARVRALLEEAKKAS
ncbi:DUF262 domain-containing protein [Pseudomonas sp. EMN2]|uniref:DUF262 domain-containing protein n=1 Tax=Pseudomonas sp. EMN2 TaxID=2615212 RepID=UPI00129A364B|nr:DUF262 domain-containing protein [Pseudomonas sp. EMN2]